MFNHLFSIVDYSSVDSLFTSRCVFFTKWGRVRVCVCVCVWLVIYVLVVLSTSQLLSWPKLIVLVSAGVSLALLIVVEVTLYELVCVPLTVSITCLTCCNVVVSTIHWFHGCVHGCGLVHWCYWEGLWLSWVCVCYVAGLSPSDLQHLLRYVCIYSFHSQDHLTSSSCVV